MASEETLRVVTDLSPEEAITRWLAGLGVEAPIKTEVGERTVYYAEGPGMILYAAETSQRARDYMQQTYGIAPNLEIAFELDFCRDRSAPRTTIIKGSLDSASVRTPTVACGSTTAISSCCSSAAATCACSTTKICGRTRAFSFSRVSPTPAKPCAPTDAGVRRHDWRRPAIIVLTRW